MKLKNFLIILSLVIFISACSSDNDNSSESISSTDTEINTDTSILYNTIIDDDFSYADTSVWESANWSNGDPFYNTWCPSQNIFSSDNLSINLEQTDCNGESNTHASGEYRSKSTYKYGRYTIRMKTSDVNGTISSLFTYTGPAEGTEHDEIDIEHFGKDPTKMQVNYWRNGAPHEHIIDLGFDASQDFHEYSFEWNAQSIKWYVDGKLVHTVEENGLNNNDSLPVNAGKIMMNLWAGTGVDEWTGTYVDNTPATAVYDYFKFEEEQ